MKLTPGIEAVLRRLRSTEKPTSQDFYAVASGLSLSEPMVQSSHHAGKMPSNRRFIRIEEDEPLLESVFVEGIPEEK